MSVIEEVWQKRIRIRQGAAELIATMRRFGGVTALISGGFTEFTGRVAERLGFDHHFANELTFANGKFTGHVEEPVLGKESKCKILELLMKQHSVTTDETIAVGDGANDIGMLAMSGTGIAYMAKPVVNRQATHQIRFHDLTSLLYLQGYSKSEILSN